MQRGGSFAKQLGYMYMFPSFLAAGLIYSLMKKEVGVEMEMCMGPVPTTLMCIKLS